MIIICFFAIIFLAFISLFFEIYAFLKRFFMINLNGQETK